VLGFAHAGQRTISHPDGTPRVVEVHRLNSLRALHVPPGTDVVIESAAW
jgi:hypothetical protein